MTLHTTFPTSRQIEVRQIVHAAGRLHPADYALLLRELLERLPTAELDSKLANAFGDAATSLDTTLCDIALFVEDGDCERTTFDRADLAKLEREANPYAPAIDHEHSMALRRAGQKELAA